MLSEKENCVRRGGIVICVDEDQDQNGESGATGGLKNTGGRALDHDLTILRSKSVLIGFDSG